MGSNFSRVTRVTRTAFRSVRRRFRGGYFAQNLLLDIGQPSAERPLILRNGEQTSSTATHWDSLEVVCCELGTECKLYISVYNERHTRVIYATIYQDTATSTRSTVEVFWTNPRTGSSDAITFICPVEARAIKDLFV